MIAGIITLCHADEHNLQFSRDVLPVLADRCFHCHGPDADHREADLRLDQRESAVDDSGVIVPWQPTESELIARITTTDQDLLMPPPASNRAALTSDEIEILKRWIAEGAAWSTHWSFEKPRKSLVDATAGHPIDVLIERRLREAGLEPASPADKRTLIRRVTLDLIGLPPTLDEVAAFLADDSIDAYANLVDRLLSSPHYGERMAWPWLDAARYADTSGFQGDPERTMWPWRDWVIDALNNNMPFDQFTIEQLAGDLLPNATPEQKLATGFNRNHMHNGEGGRIAEETRVENVFDRTETTGTVWLGLTLQCARCHDHKFDPTSNDDYFAFFDFFNQTTESGAGNGSRAVPPAMDYLAATDRERVAQLDDQLTKLSEELSPSSDEDLERLREERSALQKSNSVQVMVMDTIPQPRQTLVLLKGVYNNPTDRRVIADVPRMLPRLHPAAIANAVPPHVETLHVEASNSEPPSANRLDLAKWIVSPENPLTARVTVNRLWQTFFGRGLVSTPSDFGLQGAQPTHPELLDWLAVELVESGWDVKQLQRLIVTSRTYQQSAQVTPELLDRDPQNELLSRAPRYRMPSWMIRDHALATSGLLQLKLGGPPVKSYQPEGIWGEATFGKINYELGSGDQLYRRSIYSFWRRIVGPTIFFDAARRQTCEVQPNLTNTPLHALTTLNDVTYVEAARIMAERLMLAQPSNTARVIEAFETLTARLPTAEEQELLVGSLNDAIARFSHAPELATELLSVGNSPRDTTVDPAQQAALTTLINTLMNLDEVLVKP